jgi:hypothetical protein
MFHRRWLGVCLTMAAGLLLAAIPGRLGMAQSSSNRWWTGYGNGPDNSRGRGRGAAAPYPEGLPDWERYVINEYHTVGDLIAPPFTSIVKYDLNEPGIEWSIGFGDDPELALQGVTGTGVPGLLNGIVVTASGIVFGAGGDNRIRAWSSDDARELWSSEFGGTFVGSPVMYEMNGRAYLLVPASGRAPGISTGGPLGWVAYSLPE